MTTITRAAAMDLSADLRRSAEVLAEGGLQSEADDRFNAVDDLDRLINSADGTSLAVPIELTEELSSLALDFGV